MTHIFISYSRKDKEFAKRLTDELKKSDLDIWIDWEDIPPTAAWWKEIEEGIEEADEFLFLISPDSSKSKVCRQEIDHAIKNGKRLIPLVIRETNSNEVPPQLSPLNWIFFRKEDDFDEVIKQLLTSIHTDYEWVQQHRWLQVRALDWQQANKDSGSLLRGKDLQNAEFQLAANTSKEPYPTDLQREYVFNSRKATDRQRRLVTSISIAGVIALSALTIFGFVKARLATSNEIKAIDNASTAQAVSTIAVSNASTAQAASTLAVSNEQRAVREAEIALARQLAAQAQPLFANGNSKQQTAVLLAVQSMRLFPNLDAAQVLQNNTLARSIIQMKYDGSINAIALSSDSKYVVIGSSDNTARVWEIFTGKEIARTIHDNEVYAVAFSRDSKFVVSGSDDHTVRLWEALTGKEVARMRHGDMVNSVAFSPNGMYIVSGCFDNTARVWEVTTGHEVARMTHNSYVNSVAFSPNGNYVVSGSADNTARVWEALTGKEVARMTHHVAIVPIIGGGGGGRIGGDGVSSVAFSPNGLYVVSGGCDERDNVSRCIRGTAYLWQSQTGQLIARMTHNGQVSTVAFSFDGKYVVSGSYDETLVIWEATTGKVISNMIHNGPVNYAAFSPNGEYMISGSEDGTARVWEVKTGKEIARTTHDGPVSSVAFSLDGKYVVSGGFDRTVRVWEPVLGNEFAHMTFGNYWHFSPDSKYMIAVVCDKLDYNDFCVQESIYVWEVATGQMIASISQNGLVSSIAFSHDSRYLVFGSDDHTVRVFDLSMRQEIIRMTHEKSVNSVRFSPNGHYIVSSSWDLTARVWESSTGQEIARMTHNSPVYSAVFSPTGKYVVSGSQDDVRVWEITTGKEILRISDGFVYTLAFSPDGRFVLSAGGGTAHVWEVATGNEVSRMKHNGTVRSAVFSPNGKLVLSTGGATAIVWETNTGKEIARKTYDKWVGNAAFSPDGSYVVSGGCDKTVNNVCLQGTARVWEADTGKEIARKTYDDEAFSVHFSPDGRYVISSGGDNTDLWMYRSNDLIVLACSRVIRNLTHFEWQQYLGDSLPYKAICPDLSIGPEELLAPTLTPTP